MKHFLNEAVREEDSWLRFSRIVEAGEVWVHVTNGVKELGA